MPKQTAYSMCGMCRVRCPIQADVENGTCRFIQGNPHLSGIKGGLCTRGAAGSAQRDDEERPQFPMIRKGTRGEGRWQRASWDEALGYVAQKLQAVISQFGSRSLMWSDEGGPFTDLYQAFTKGLGSPNYFSAGASWDLNNHQASRSLFGLGSAHWRPDFRNARHVVLQTRNLFESIDVQAVNELLDGLAAGSRLTVIDSRATVSAGKADRFLLIRPGTDYALNLAVIQTLIQNRYYNEAFVNARVNGFGQFADHISLCSPAWAEKETGIPADAILALAAELAEAAPAVIWHPGWMTARYLDSFQVCRSAYIINVLLGSLGARGGMAWAATPEDVGQKGLRKFTTLFPAPSEKRADGAGWKHPHLDGSQGLLHLGYAAIASADPYPVKGYIACQHDPLGTLPDPHVLRKQLEGLDLLVSITASWSETAWNADVVLPLSNYLERESILAQVNGPKPYFCMRQRCIAPLFDTRADWEVIAGLAGRLDLKPLAFPSIEALWEYQLQETGVGIRDFAAKGFVELCERPFYADKFSLGTPTGKIELLNPQWEQMGIAPFTPYVPKPAPPRDSFRLTIGRCALHAGGETVNNPLLFRQMPENVLWINSAEAQRMGIAAGEEIEVSSNGTTARIKALPTEYIHPEAVFMVHGFGRNVPAESRAMGRGVSDTALMPGGLELWDRHGGALAMQEHFVRVRKL